MKQAADTPFVSVVIPCRNEEPFIAKVLHDLEKQDYPKGHFEILLAEGRSEDKTREIILDFAALNADIKLIDNPQKIVPTGLNAAIRQARGEVIVRMDAHSEYPTNYLSELVTHLQHLNADNVGGVWITLPGAPTSVARAIALATSHPFGIGNASYRLGAKEIKKVDTVPYGCYKREVFDRIGLFDEQLVRNQDDEFNARLIQSGGSIYLIPWVHIRYYARPTIAKMRKMFFQYGLFKPLVNKKTGKPATLRQFVPPLFVLSLLATLLLGFWRWPFWVLFALLVLLHLLAGLYVGFKLAGKSEEKLSPWIFPRVFFLIHLSYGWGYLRGLMKFAFSQDKRTQTIELSR